MSIHFLGRSCFGNFDFERVFMCGRAQILPLYLTVLSTCAGVCFVIARCDHKKTIETSEDSA